MFRRQREDSNALLRVYFHVKLQGRIIQFLRMSDGLASEISRYNALLVKLLLKSQPRRE